MVMVRSGKPRRIGVFGGTFNPVHYGHLINIELIREQYKFDLILFIPSKIPVHKTITDIVQPSDRFAMVKLAISGNSYFEASDIEINRESPSYTITTLEELKSVYPGDELFLIIGSDSFNELDTWKEYRKILSDYPVVIMQRRTDPELRKDILTAAARIELFSGTMIDISSSMIRERIRNNNSIKYLTTESVIDFIINKGLYKIEQ
jgi:nicotinate-nucleotide adenylyltransferase